MLETRLTKHPYIPFFNSLFFLLFLSACDFAAPLNSERIEQRYGNYAIEILQSNDKRRLSSLYSVNGGQKTMRTLAQVEFISGSDPRIAGPHQRILAAESIGAVFKEEGWSIDKVSSRFCRTHLNIKSMPELSRMRISPPANLATHTYVFRVRKGATSIDYATITEIHHPDYLRAADLTTDNLADC